MQHDHPSDVGHHVSCVYRSPTCKTSRASDLLADEKYVYGAEIEVVVEWKSCKAIVGWVLSGIELCRDTKSIL